MYFYREMLAKCHEELNKVFAEEIRLRLEQLPEVVDEPVFQVSKLLCLLIGGE